MLYSSISIVPQEILEQRIYLIRGKTVMLSQHLAELYGVQPKVLVQAVKRNYERFPDDFMFQLSKLEFYNLKSQIVTSNDNLNLKSQFATTEGRRGQHGKYLPYAFTTKTMDRQNQRHWAYFQGGTLPGHLWYRKMRHLQSSICATSWKQCRSGSRPMRAGSAGEEYAAHAGRPVGRLSGIQSCNPQRTISQYPLQAQLLRQWLANRIRYGA